MEHFGLSTGYVLVQIFNFGFLIGWPLISIAALAGLKQQHLPPTAKALWALIILAIPYLGAAAYWFVKPQGE